MARKISVLHVAFSTVLATLAGVAIAAPTPPAQFVVQKPGAPRPSANVDLTSATRFSGNFSDGVGRVEVVGDGITLGSSLGMVRTAGTAGSKLTARVREATPADYRVRFTFTNLSADITLAASAGNTRATCSLKKGAGDQVCEIVTKGEGTFSVTVGFDKATTAGALSIKSVQVVREPPTLVVKQVAPPASTSSPPPPAPTTPGFPTCNPVSCPSGNTASQYCPAGPDSGFGSDCTLLQFCTNGCCCYACGQVGGTPPQCG